jgi:hypothetical protein
MRIAAESSVKDVVERYPSTGPVFVQAGPLYVNPPHELYVRFPDLSVSEFAQRNGSDLAALLKQLNALAESEEATRATAGGPRPSDRAGGRGGFSLTIGYTGSYRPEEDSVPERISVVAVQAARGPE